MTERYFKILRHDGASPYAAFPYSLPSNDAPGDWMEPVRGKLAPCCNGYHLCRLEDVVWWWGGRQPLYEAQIGPDYLIDGDVFEENTKVVAREVRLLREIETADRQLYRQWACDCVSHMLSLLPEENTDIVRAGMYLLIRDLVRDGYYLHPAVLLAARPDVPRMAILKLWQGFPTSALRCTSQAGRMGLTDALTWNAERLAQLVDEPRSAWVPVA